MQRRVAFAVTCLAALAGSSGCQLLNTSDAENVAGRGPTAFDPYQSNQSGAIKLSLMSLNGCAILPTGEQIGRGSAPVPYPETCRPLELHQAQGGSRNKPIQVLTNTKYFLSQLALMETVQDTYNDPERLNEVADWFRALPVFGKLDWRGLGIASDGWTPSRRTPGSTAWNHLVQFGGAAWQLKREDSFLVELIDSNGTVREKLTYNRSDFLAENPAVQHSVLLWEQDNLAPPRFPGDKEVRHAAPPPPGYPPLGAITSQNLFKMEVNTSTNPNKQMTIPEGLTGDGAFKVTWSQVPNDPFYFPVTFVSSKELPKNCYKGENPAEKVACTFGVVPEVTFGRPKNGEFFEPGERIQINFAVKDSNGNFLHPPDRFPSWNEYARDEANGILYLNMFNIATIHDVDTITTYQLGGPKQEMRPIYELSDDLFYRGQTDQMAPGVGNDGSFNVGHVLAAQNAVIGMRDHHQPTVHHYNLPKTAKPGTYVLVWKVNRYFMGERFTKAVVTEFPVGQKERTNYPNRVGNCQICHRGALSLDNVRHGIPVDHIETCKMCHNRDLFPSQRGPTQAMFHAVHMSSPKFPMAKKDCGTCHLTRESALKPTLVACGSCHPTVHGNEFFNILHSSDADVNNTNTIYSTCANQCHVATPPSSHILPPQ